MCVWFLLPSVLLEIERNVGSIRYIDNLIKVMNDGVLKLFFMYCYLSQLGR